MVYSISPDGQITTASLDHAVQLASALRARRRATKQQRAQLLRRYLYEGLRRGKKPWEILEAPLHESVPGQACAEVQPGRYRVRKPDGSWGPWVDHWRAVGTAIVDAMQAWPSLSMIIDVLGFTKNDSAGDQEKAHSGVFFNPPKETFPARSLCWQWDGVTPRVVLRGRNPDRSHPIVQGLVWQSGSGVELWGQDIDFCAAEGASAVIGNPGQVGAMRLLRCDLLRPVDPDQQAAFYGKGFNWGTRTYGGGLQMTECGWLAPAREHIRYEQNFAFLIAHKSKLGSGGRTSFQGGTRMDTPQPESYLGFLVDDCELIDGHSGSGGGGIATSFGFAGPTVIRNTKIQTDAHHPNNDNQAVAVWEASNYGGVADPDGDDFATPLLVLHNIEIDAPYLDRSAIQAESFACAYFGSIVGNAPKMFIDLGDQWPSGPIGKWFLIDEDVPPLRTRNGNAWHTYSEDERKAHHWTESLEL